MHIAKIVLIGSKLMQFSDSSLLGGSVTRSLSCKSMSIFTRLSSVTGDRTFEVLT